MFPRRSTDNLITLSLTEAAFILVFAVLLLIGSRITLVIREEATCQDSLTQCNLQRVACEESHSACRSLLSKATAKPGEFVSRLIDAEKAAHQIASLKEELEKAKRETDALKYLQKHPLPDNPARIQAALELLSGFEAGNGSSVDPATARKVGAAAGNSRKELQNCQGQMKFCKARLGTSGFGLPPCWIDQSDPNDPTVRIEYLFAVELRTDGVKVSRSWPDHRERDARALPGAVELADASVMSLAAFQQRTLGIFQASKMANPECRHYVKLTRSPSLKDIELFNRLRLGVEDHFYKLDLTQAGR